MERKRDTRTGNTHRRGPSVTPLVGRQLEFKNFDRPICRTRFAIRAAGTVRSGAFGVIVFHSQLLDRNKSSLLLPFSLFPSLPSRHHFFSSAWSHRDTKGSLDFAMARGTAEGCKLVRHRVENGRGEGKRDEPGPEETHLHRQVSDGESLDWRILDRGVAIKLSSSLVPLDGVQRVTLGVVPTIQRRRLALLHGRWYLDTYFPQTRADS